MKTVIAILLLMFLSSCNTDTSNTVAPPSPQTNSSDSYPCTSFLPIHLTDTSDFGYVYVSADVAGIYIDGLQTTGAINKIEIKASAVPLTHVNKFPIKYNRPTLPFSTFVSWNDLNLASCSPVYLYIKIHSVDGIAWVGDLRYVGRGAWHYYSSLFLCTTN